MNDSNVENEQINKSDAKGPEFFIQRIYVKDVSYESPKSPEIFKSEWSPEVEIGLDVSNKKLSDEIYEVVIKITVTAKLKDKVAFLVEVKQAGIFTLKSFSNEQLHHMLGIYCPNMLFPYARELISGTVNRGGFPPIYLAPVNFEALYHQKIAAEKK